MKILHVIFSLTNGGAENMLIDIVDKQVVDNRIFLMIINEKYDSDLLAKISPNITIIKCGRNKSIYSSLVFICVNLYIFFISPDIIHCHNETIIKGILPLFRKKCFLTVHHLSNIKKHLCKFRSLFAISQNVQEYLRDQVHLNSEVVYNGINFQNIKCADNNVCSYFPGNEFRIVQVSRLEHDVKGQDLLIKALKRLNNQGYTNIKVDFIGKGSSLTYLKELTDKNGLKTSIHFLGEKDREYIYENLRDYQLLIQPSRNEGFGLTIVEALGAKVPVLVADNGGPAEIIKNGRYGDVFTTGDDVNLADKIKYIMCNYVVAKNKCLDGYEYVRKIFDISLTVDHYSRIYQKYL